MRRRATIIVGAVALLAVGVMTLTLLQKQRINRDYLYTVNNFRELGQFLELNPDWAESPANRFEAPGRQRFQPVPREQLMERGFTPEIPAGTRSHPRLQTIERQSFLATLLPTLNQKRQPTEALFSQLDVSQPWDAPPNAAVARTPLDVLQVYSRPIVTPPNEPVVTAILGLGGVGPDAATGPDSPGRGAFHLARATQFTMISDGLSQTGVFADAATDLGPWLRGGPSTVRTLDKSREPLGPAGQFGGNFPAGALFGYADHSVRVHSYRTDPAVIANLMTIAGHPNFDPLPGE